MTIPIRHSTALAVIVGPVLDADGVAVTDAGIGNFRLSKNGATPAAWNGAATATHQHSGNYRIVGTPSDSDTVGLAQITIDKGTDAMQAKDLQVIEQQVYDAMYAAGAEGFSTFDHTSDQVDVGWIETTDVTEYFDALVTTITTAITALQAKILRYFRLALRKDAAVAADHSTELDEINANTGTGPGEYANTTDSPEATSDAMIKKGTPYTFTNDDLSRTAAVTISEP